jgi:hypothetical protein
MGPGNLAGGNCEGPKAPAVPFDPLGMDKHGVGTPRHSRTSRVPAFKETGGAGFRAPLSPGSTFKRFSLRMAGLKRPPSGLSWSL